MINSDKTNKQTPDLTYAFPFQHERYKYFWDREILLKNNLKSIVLENAILLPPVQFGKKKHWGIGGVIDANLNPVPLSWLPDSNGAYMGGSYVIDKKTINSLTGEYIYGGLLINHWGHFLLDLCTRLYYFLENQDKKVLFLVRPMENPKFFPAIMRFLNILGLNTQSLHFINHPTQVDKLIIPEPSYSQSSYCSEKYFSIIDKITQSITPTINHSYDKILLSRIDWNKGDKREYGLELIEELFKDQGYTSIALEKESLDNQIYYLLKAKSIAVTSGSAMHTLMFSRNRNQEIFFINKSYIINTAQIETLRFTNSSTHILDFYASRFPVSAGRGPFLFLKNNLMDIFIKNYSIQNNNAYLFSNSYAKDCIQAYVSHIEKNKSSSKRFVSFSNDKNSYAYLDPTHIYDWERNYSRYESQLIPQENENFEKGEKLMLNNKDQQDNSLTYEAHYSNIGWNGDSAFGNSISKNNKETIEAIRIRLNSNINIYYSVFYTHEGWTDPVFNWEICGTTGKAKRINGLKIWIDDTKSKNAIQYRVHTDKWSDWKSNGSEIFSDNGFNNLELRLIPQSPIINSTRTSSSEYCVERLNSLASTYNIKKYLEIGVQRGYTFHKIKAPHKTGVDPNFLFDINQYENIEGIYLINSTSDNFFANISSIKENIYKQKNLHYDLIFIDGLHTYEQVLKDFVNSFKHSHSKTIWVFDDTVPSDPYSALPDLHYSYKLRELAGLKSRPWHGDVFKAIFALHDFYPNFSYVTVLDAGNPQTFVWQTREPAERIPLFKDIKEIKNLTYFDMLRNFNIFHPVSQKELFNLIYTKNINKDYKFDLSQIIEKLY